jgi:hypothetical protein
MNAGRGTLQPAFRHTNHALVAIMRYSNDQTGANSQAGGLNDGFRKRTYHVLTEVDVHTDPTTATDEQIPMKSAKVSQGLLDTGLRLQLRDLFDVAFRIEFSSRAG